ncbi:MAG: sirohydrochlorin cobaltochelatase [Verrucomicrobiota bacterium]
MPQENFSKATLIVLGHGSTKNTESSAPVYQHASELRGRKIFHEVREAFWKQEPQIKQVLANVSSPQIFIAPLFISEGYFASEVIPRELGFPPGQSTLHSQLSTLLYCQPIGTHDSMTGVLLARAREVIAKFPFPRLPKAKETTLFIAGHGTEQNKDSSKAIDRQVELIRAMNEYATVHSVFMEQSPRIPEVFSLAQTKNIVVLPFFISDGMHTQEDIPVLLGEPERIVKQRLASGQPTWRNPTERNGKLIWYSPAVGTEPQIAYVILERVREAANCSGGL